MAGMMIRETTNPMANRLFFFSLALCYFLYFKQIKLINLLVGLAISFLYFSFEIAENKEDCQMVGIIA
jgi:hypothetical protein